MLPHMRWGMQENWQPTLHLPTGVWHCPHLCDNTYLVACKIPRGFKIGRVILFVPLLLHSFPQSLAEVMVGADLCNPASHLEQDCLQHQLLSAVALAAQSLITAGGVDVTTFWVTCSSSAYPPSPIFFFIISKLNVISHNMWSLPLPASTKRSGPVTLITPHSNPVGRSL